MSKTNWLHFSNDLCSVHRPNSESWGILWTSWTYPNQPAYLRLIWSLEEITITPQTTLAEARRLIGSQPAAPAFFVFLQPTDNSPVSIFQEHLKSAIRNSREDKTILLRLAEEINEQAGSSSSSGSSKAWEVEKRELIEEHSRRVHELEEENTSLKARLLELERELSNRQYL